MLQMKDLPGLRKMDQILKIMLTIAGAVICRTEAVAMETRAHEAPDVVGAIMAADCGVFLTLVDI